MRSIPARRCMWMVVEYSAARWRGRAAVNGNVLMARVGFYEKNHRG